jgi:hypothetical protein
MLFESMKDQHFSENARGFSGGQGSARLKVALRAGEILVYPMPQLMGDRHHVPMSAGIIDQDIGVNRGDRAMAECPSPLSWSKLCIDPTLFKKEGCDLPHPGRELSKGCKDHLPALGIINRTVLLEKGGVPVVIVEPVDS